MKQKNVTIAALNFWSLNNIGDRLIYMAFLEFVRRFLYVSKIYIITYDPESFNMYVKKDEDYVEVIPTLSKTLENIISVKTPSFKSKKLKVLIGILSIIFHLIILKLFQYFSSDIEYLKEKLDESDIIFLLGGNYITAHKGKVFFLH